MQHERAKPILTLKETALMLRVNKQTLVHLLMAGTIPAVKTGRQWRILSASVDAFLRGDNGQSSGPKATRPAA